MKKLVIFGVGTFGRRLALKASSLGAAVTTLDKEPDTLKRVRDYVAQAQVLDCRDERAVKEKLDEGFDIAVVAMHRDFSTVLLLVIYIKEIGIDHIVARAETSMQKAVLERLGVDEVILPEYEMGQRVAERLILNQSEQLEITSDTGIVHIKIPRNLVGYRIEQLDMFEKYAIRLIMVRREYLDQNFSRFIEPTEKEVELTENDFLIVMGKTRRIAKMIDDLT